MALGCCKAWSALAIEEFDTRLKLAPRAGEVSELDLRRRAREEDIVWLDVAMDHAQIVVQVGDRRGQLSEEVLGDLLSLAIRRVLLSQRLLLQIFEVVLHKVEDLLISHVTFLLEVPVGYLVHICDL